LARHGRRRGAQHLAHGDFTLARQGAHGGQVDIVGRRQQQNQAGHRGQPEHPLAVAAQCKRAVQIGIEIGIRKWAQAIFDEVATAQRGDLLGIFAPHQR